MTIVKNKQTAGNKPIYYKSIDAENIVIDEVSRIIKFYATGWNNIDDSQDLLIKGCCAKSIAERGPGSKTNRKITFLWQHDTTIPLGKPTELKEDDKGLYVECPIDKILKGDETLTQLQSGTLNQFSIGYQYVWDKCEWTEVEDPSNPGTMVYALVVKEIELFEVSVVTFGCNEETGFVGMKASQLESHRNSLARDTERTLKSLSPEHELQIRQLIAKHISLATAEPGKPTPPENEPSKKGLSIDFKIIANAFN